MPFPFLVLGAGALIGAGITYVLQENDKKGLREANSKLEESHRRAEQRLREATDREIQNRIAHTQLLLRLYQERLQNLLNQPEVNLTRLARLTATASQLAVVADRLRPDGTPQAGDKLFIELVSNAMDDSLPPLTRVQLAQLDEYLESELPGAMVRFLKERYATLFADKSERLRTHDREQHELREKLAICEVQLQLSRPGDAAIARSELAMTRARLDNLPSQIAALERDIDDIRKILVVTSRLAAPDRVPNAHDVKVLELLSRKVDGAPLLEAEREFLQAYQRKYFGEERERLHREGIDLAGLHAMAAP